MKPVMEQLKDEYPKVEGVEYDINKRWEEGFDHHPRSLELLKKIQDVDFIWNNDYFQWKYGGDGDNGEFLMYVLDIIFEEQDYRPKDKDKYFQWEVMEDIQEYHSFVEFGWNGFIPMVVNRY